MKITTLSNVVRAIIAVFLVSIWTSDCKAQQFPVGSPSPSETAPSSQSESGLLSESAQELNQGQLDAALEKVNVALKLDPRNRHALLQRGMIYAKQSQWDKATYDYQIVLDIDPNNIAAKFSLAELKFMQKKYDDARAGFVELKGDSDLGDFATYKVLLCDLFGAHEEAADKDLQALNEVGGNPSYYFGNVAWSLVHKKTDDAKDWLESATRIYANAPDKVASYTASLKSLGYLPLPASLAQ